MRRLFLALALLSLTASAEQVCSSQFNPMTGQYDWVCVERPSQVSGPPPVCHQQYDALTNTWHTVCS